MSLTINQSVLIGLTVFATGTRKQQKCWLRDFDYASVQFQRGVRMELQYSVQQYDTNRQSLSTAESLLYSTVGDASSVLIQLDRCVSELTQDDIRSDVEIWLTLYATLYQQVQQMTMEREVYDN